MNHRLMRRGRVVAAGAEHLVVAIAQDSCDALGGACAVLCRPFSRTEARITVKRGTSRAAPGDEVDVAVSARGLARAMALAFLPPLIGTVGGAALGAAGGGDAMTMALACAGLALGGALGAVCTRGERGRALIQPTVLNNPAASRSQLYGIQEL